MKLIASIAFLALITFFLLISHAGTQYGVGGKSCGTWLDKRRTNDHFDMAQWMLGYISAAQYYAVDLKESEAQAFMAYMDNYCQQKPLDDFVVGVHQLINELREKPKP